MKVTDIAKIVRQMGVPWTWFRVNYELRKTTGLLKRKFPEKICSDEEFFEKFMASPSHAEGSLSAYFRENRGSFLLDSTRLPHYKECLERFLSNQDRERILKIADNARHGRIWCFSRWTADYGYPINWHLNPVSNYEWPRGEHWVDIEELSPGTGDVKYVWEASRFTQVFYFVRAYTLTKNEKYAEAYWNQIEQWLEENPYQLGINWKCGQEVSFRTFAWIFGLFAFLDSPRTTDSRIHTLLKSIYFNAIRVEGNIDFARKAVQNNHAISEAACLFTVGILFPFFKDSSRFLAKGQKYLEQEGLKQIYEDGSYIQHSTNYHRLMLQIYTWCFQIGRNNGLEFDESLEERLNRAIDFLYQIQDGISGKVPNYGANDGALVFPFSCCDFLDYRPQLNTLNYIIHGAKLYDEGKHVEDLLWFCGPEAVGDGSTAPPRRTSKGFPKGGYYVIRDKDTFGMIRCTKFKHRPSHADMLHVDLWYKGINILTDIGSYSYNPEDQFHDYFEATRNHNTITVNNSNQSRRGPRFLSIDWPEGRLLEFDIDGKAVRFSGYHTAYGSFIHTRRIEYTDNHYLIVDEVENRTGEEITIKLNWNVGTDIVEMTGNKYQLQVDSKETVNMGISSLTNGMARVYYGDGDIPAGWRSLYYGQKFPLNQLVYEVTSGRKTEVVRTVISL